MPIACACLQWWLFSFLLQVRLLIIETCIAGFYQCACAMVVVHGDSCDSNDNEVSENNGMSQPVVSFVRRLGVTPKLWGRSEATPFGLARSDAKREFFEPTPTRKSARLHGVTIDQRTSDRRRYRQHRQSTSTTAIPLEQNVRTISTRVFPPQHSLWTQILTSDRTDGCRKEARPDRQEAHRAVQASPK
jgi:hypothetical protein